MNIIFDLDGVLSNTSRMHCKAWVDAVNAFEAHFYPESSTLFTAEDFERYLNGKGRGEGLRCIAKIRGWPDDSIFFNRVINDKNSRFLSLLNTEIGNSLFFEDAKRAIEFCNTMSINYSICTSSKNARKVLERADFKLQPKALVDGNIIDTLSLKPKPSHESFSHCAEVSGFQLIQTVIFEDSLAGLEGAIRAKPRMVVSVIRDSDTASIRNFERSQIVAMASDAGVKLCECQDLESFISELYEDTSNRRVRVRRN